MLSTKFPFFPVFSLLSAFFSKPPDCRWQENLLARNFTPTAPNHVWTSDITYQWTDEGWLYLAIVLVSTDWPINRVAGERGFANLGHFFRRFAAQKGCTPTEFLRRPPS